MSWLYLRAAEAVMALHLAFVGFVVIGGFLSLRYPRLPWLHLPAAAWAILLSLFGWVCPLTPLENRLLAEAGAETYESGFLARYLRGVLYPDGLGAAEQYVLAGFVLGINAVAYGVVWRRSRRRSGTGGNGASGSP